MSWQYVPIWYHVIFTAILLPLAILAGKMINKRLEQGGRPAVIMWKMIFYFVLVNLGYFALVFTICTIGFEYDKANQLYPEVVQLSYDLSISGVYGQRWVRFWQVAVPSGLLTDLVIGSFWYLKRLAKPVSLNDANTY